jgi:hypothetical protein
MPLVATAPLAAPPELLGIARAVYGALARVRFASEDALLAYGGPLGLTRQMLAEWTAAGLLARGVVTTDPLSGARKPYLALAAAGAKALAAVTGQTIEGISTVRLRRFTQKRAHDVATGDFALAALALERDRLLETVGVEVDDRKLATSAFVARRGRVPERVALQADALVVGRVGSRPAALLVEIDRATSSPAKMSDRYAGYLAWKCVKGPERDFSLRALRVLTVVPSETRLRRLHDAALESNGGRRSGFLLFALASDIHAREPRRLLGPVAKPLDPGSEDRVPLFSRPPA